MSSFEIIDISQPVAASTACFPGDVPFSREVTVRYGDSQVMNLCAMTMSPHVGTHADAPVHVRGSLEQPAESAGQLSLSPFIGPAVVVDVAPWRQAVTWAHIEAQLAAYGAGLPPRVLFKTAESIRYDVFEEAYAWLDAGLIPRLADRGVTLVGLDTPSVDPIQSKSLDTHHALLKAGMSWLENLDLSPVHPKHPEPYFLVALPLKLMEMEASPVRAVLLKGQSLLES